MYDLAFLQWQTTLKSQWLTKTNIDFLFTLHVSSSVVTFFCTSSHSRTSAKGSTLVGVCPFYGRRKRARELMKICDGICYMWSHKHITLQAQIKWWWCVALLQGGGEWMTMNNNPIFYSSYPWQGYSNQQFILISSTIQIQELLMSS